ncbi:MAG: DUF6728 family protein [Bacteroidota bacterium]
MEVFKKIWGYLSFKKQTSEDSSNFNLRMMHGINRISLIMFVIAIVLIILKLNK